MNVIITGANRGLGLALTKKALKEKNKVLAIYRSHSEDLDLLFSEYPDLLILCQQDLKSASFDKIIKSAHALTHIDLLFNNAGILKESLVVAAFQESFLVNAVAPFLLARELVPFFKKSPSPKVISLTSQMGSISDNSSGGYHPYRSSKAALNMLMKGFSIDHPDILSVMIHPGWVQTAMGGAGALISASHSAKNIWELVQQLGLEQTGKFYDYRGHEIGW
jgi:NAD(P)-dependent dehydrogenase (short-subunit alcohol dehydrogenase family)